MLCLLFNLVFLCSHAQTAYTSYGKVFRIASSHSMFPDSVRNKLPRIYQGITYAAEEHYRDSSLFIFVPSYFDNRKPYHLIFWFHGWNNNIDSALQQFKLVEQFSNAHLNAVFVFPEGPKNSPDSYGGKFEQPLFFDGFVLDVMNELLHKNIITVKQRYDISLAGHSGAYRVISYILLHSINKAKAIVLFDALYGEEEKFAMHLQQNPNCKFINIYTDEGGTLQPSKNLMLDMDAWKWKYLQREEDACTDAELKKNRIVFLHSNKVHNDVITNNNNFEKFLRSLF